ncbi:MAG: hypothetical protein AB7I50_22925 [Vicinamibacterales bacterium]
MNRQLRQRHRRAWWTIAALVILGALVFELNRPADARVDTLPAPLLGSVYTEGAR